MKNALNIGCGLDYRTSTPEVRLQNLDGNPDVHADVRLPLDQIHVRFPVFFDEIVANDILEHVPYFYDDQTRWLNALRSWVWSLAPGGTIRIQVPDLQAITEMLGNGSINLDTANRVIFGESTNQWDRHYQTFTLESISLAMCDVGLEVLEASNVHVCAVVLGRKRN